MRDVCRRSRKAQRSFQRYLAEEFHQEKNGERSRMVFLRLHSRGARCRHRARDKQHRPVRPSLRPTCRMCQGRNRHDIAGSQRRPPADTPLAQVRAKSIPGRGCAWASREFVSARARQMLRCLLRLHEIFAAEPRARTLEHRTTKLAFFTTLTQYLDPAFTNAGTIIRSTAS